MKRELSAAMLLAVSQMQQSMDVKDEGVSHQVVLYSIAGRSGSGGDSQLVVDRANMGIDGDDPDDKPFRDLRAR